METFWKGINVETFWKGINDYGGGGSTGCAENDQDYMEDIPAVVQCRTCSNVCNGNPLCEWNKNKTTQKKIWGLVRESSSSYLGTISSVTVVGPLRDMNSNKPLAVFSGVNWNQSSDRNVPSVEQRHIPRNRTRLRPGSFAGGNSKGVDIKHNSYARFLARKKGKHLTTRPNLSQGPDTLNLEKPIQGNKQYLLGLDNCYYCN